jgi:hypothetical protein
LLRAQDWSFRAHFKEFMKNSTKPLLLASLALLLCLAACSSDEETYSEDTNNGTINDSGDDGGDDDGGVDVNNPDDGGEEPDEEPDNSANNSVNNDGNNVEDPNNGGVTLCPEGTLIVLSPVADEPLTAEDDTDPEEPGVQIAVRVASTLPEGSVLTVENVSHDFSLGAVITGPETVVQGLPLEPGTNVLKVTADTEECTATAPRLQLVLEEDDEPACGEQVQACQVDSDCAGGEVCEAGCCQEDTQVGATYRFLLIEDLTDPVSGNTPGADIDAIELDKGALGVRYATAVEDVNIGSRGTNEFDDPQALVGPPDSDCQVRNFVALGGYQDLGYVVVSFGTAQEDVTIEPGDSIRVHELGSTLCGQYDDDPYRLAVSVSTNLGDFIEITDSATGAVSITVPALP